MSPVRPTYFFAALLIATVVALPSPCVAQNGPQLVSSTLDMNVAELALNFDTPIEAGSFVPSRLMLVSDAEAQSATGVRMRASDVSVSYPSARQVTVQLLTDMLITLKNFSSGLTVNLADTFVLLNDGAAVSRDGLLSQGNAGTAGALSSFQRDTLPPVLLESQLSVGGSGTITLNFDEPVDTALFRTNGIDVSLVGTDNSGNPLAPLLLALTFAEPPAFSTNRNVVTLFLAPASLGMIKSLIFTPAFAPERLPIRLAANTVRDVNGAAIGVIEQPMRLTNIDATGPLMASINLLQSLEGNGTATLRIRFSEAVDIDTINLAPLRILFAINSEQTQEVISTLADLRVTRVSPAVPTAASLGDVVAQKAIIAMDVDITAFLPTLRDALESRPRRAIVLETGSQVGPAFVAFRDVSGNSHEGPQQALISTDGSDFVRPQLESATLNVIDNILLLTFTKDIRGIRLTPELVSLTLRDGRTNDILAREDIVPRTSEFTVVNDQRTLRVLVSPTIVARIRPADSADAILVSMPTGAIEDVLFNPLRLQTGTIRVDVVPDVLPPTLLSFDLDVEQGELRLEFSEPVRVSTIDPTGLVLQSVSNTSALITNGEADLEVPRGADSPLETLPQAVVLHIRVAYAYIIPGTGSSRIRIRLGWDELSLLRALSKTARLHATDTSFLASANSARFVEDNFGNAMPAITRANARPANSVNLGAKDAEETGLDWPWILLLTGVAIIVSMMFLVIYMVAALRTARRKLRKRKASKTPSADPPAPRKASMARSEALAS